MIWYFLAGFIAGAVGVVKLGEWLAEREINKNKSEDHSSGSASDNSNSKQSGGRTL